MCLGCHCLYPPLHSHSLLPPETLSQLEAVVRGCPSVSRQKLSGNPPRPTLWVRWICVCACVCLRYVRMSYCHQLRPDLTTFCCFTQEFMTALNNSTPTDTQLTKHTHREKAAHSHTHARTCTHTQSQCQAELSLASPPTSPCWRQGKLSPNIVRLTTPFIATCCVTSLKNTVISPRGPVKCSTDRQVWSV